MWRRESISCLKSKMLHLKQNVKSAECSRAESRVASPPAELWSGVTGEKVKIAILDIKPPLYHPISQT